MNEYLVLWTIDAEADTPRQAARQARAAQVRPGTLAVVFDVQDTATGVVTRVDLLTPGSDDHVQRPGRRPRRAAAPARLRRQHELLGGTE